ncbi:MAG: hypothetical protein U0231_01975 [Nitrospiraceae bacterium]
MSAWEWAADWYEAGYYERSPVRKSAGARGRIIQSKPAVGPGRTCPRHLLTYGRFKLSPDTQNSYTGFRCAKNTASNTLP